MVPRIGTRSHVPKASTTSKGRVITETTPASFPSIFNLKSNFFMMVWVWLQALGVALGERQSGLDP
jgi:hypothetical protein